MKNLLITLLAAVIFSSCDKKELKTEDPEQITEYDYLQIKHDQWEDKGGYYSTTLHTKITGKVMGDTSYIVSWRNTPMPCEVKGAGFDNSGYQNGKLTYIMNGNDLEIRWTALNSSAVFDPKPEYVLLINVEYKYWGVCSWCVEYP